MKTLNRKRQVIVAPRRIHCSESVHTKQKHQQSSVMSRLFIDRTIFAWVLAIAAMLAGILAIGSLPIAQYPALSSRLTSKPKLIIKERNNP